ncbi:hypothetical protein D3C81_1853650 [compost metagenome]
MESSVQEIRSVPAGRSRRSPSASTLAPMASKCGAMERISRSPASVGETLRVVRASSRMPRRSSSNRIEWLSAEAVTPRRTAALVKLCSCATARKAWRSLVFTAFMTNCELNSVMHQLLPRLSR